MVNIQALEPKLIGGIIKYIECPLNLILACKIIHKVSSIPWVRAEWAINKFGRAHVLFHSVRLGPNFINVEVVDKILENGGVLSRYFIQRLVMHFGRYDTKLIELKIEHNIGQIDADRIRSFQQKIKSPWASNLPLSVFTHLIIVAEKKFGELTAKGNDMELFHFLSAGPYVIGEAPKILISNMNNIEELILKMLFVPFPPRPKPKRSDLHNSSANIHEEYPPKDGYENSRQLNVIARAILINKNLVILWKSIGYHQICNDVNDLVMQGALLILFPPTPTTGYRRPDKKGVKERIRELINLGFDLTYPVIGDIMQLFEPKLSDIGNILLESFIEIKNDPVNEFMHRILIESIKPERNFKKHDLWKFLNQKLEKIYDRKDAQNNTGNKVLKKMDDHLSTKVKNLIGKVEFQEKALKRMDDHLSTKGKNRIGKVEFQEKALKKMDDHLSTKGKNRIGKVEFQEKAFLDVMDRYVESADKPTGTSLIFTPKFYDWVLETFGAEAKITKRCFDDILKTRVNIDKQLVQTLDTKVQECTYEAISNIWNIYCNKHVSFEHKHMQHLSQAAHEDILNPLFKGFLWRLFKLDPTHDHKAVTPSATKKQHDDLSTSMIWYGYLVNLKDHLMISGDKLATREFKQSLESFLDVLESSEFKKESKKRKQRLVVNQSRKRRRKKET